MDDKKNLLRDNKIEGLPYNLDFVLVRKDKPSYYTCGVPDIDKMTKEQFDSELQKGLDDIEAGRTLSADEALTELRLIIKK